MPRAWLRVALAGIVLVLSAIDGVIAMKIANDYDSFPREMSVVIRQHTKPGDKLIVCGEGNWGERCCFGRIGRDCQCPSCAMWRTSRRLRGCIIC